MATTHIITGFVAIFYFHKCQTRDYTPGAQKTQYLEQTFLFIPDIVSNF